MSIKMEILRRISRENECMFTMIEQLLREQDTYTAQEKSRELEKTVKGFTNKNYHLADILLDLKELGNKWMN